MTTTSDADFASMLRVPFEFSRQPDPVPAHLRPERRVPLLLLLMDKSHGAGASWKGLQLLSWLVRDIEHVELLLTIRERGDIPNRPIVRFEPALDRTIDLAVGLGYLEQKSSRVFRLTALGKAAVRDLKASSVFQKERELMSMIKGKFTQRELSQVLEWRGR